MREDGEKQKEKTRGEMEKEFCESLVDVAGRARPDDRAGAAPLGHGLRRRRPPPGRLVPLLRGSVASGARRASESERPRHGAAPPTPVPKAEHLPFVKCIQANGVCATGTHTIGLIAHFIPPLPAAFPQGLP